MEKLNGLDLFSGIGGLSLAFSEWVTPVAYCERDRYAAGVLLSRMESGELSRAPIWDDVTSLRGDMLPPIDIIYGGFPCQDISVAGHGVGLEGKRSGLFFEIVRLAQEIKPAFIFLENVPAIRTRGLDRVIQELTQVGYDCRWTMLSAYAVGAEFKGERWFLLAKAVQPGLEGVYEAGRQVDRQLVARTIPRNVWKTTPRVHRRGDGIPYFVDRIKCLGNAVVPLQAKTAFEILLGVCEGETRWRV